MQQCNILQLYIVLIYRVRPPRRLESLKGSCRAMLRNMGAEHLENLDPTCRLGR